MGRNLDDPALLSYVAKVPVAVIEHLGFVSKRVGRYQLSLHLRYLSGYELGGRVPGEWCRDGRVGFCRRPVSETDQKLTASARILKSGRSTVLPYS